MEEFTQSIEKGSDANKSANSLLRELFDLVKYKGYSIRTQKLNGLEEWQKLRKNYLDKLSNKINLQNVDWKIKFKIGPNIESDAEKVYEIFLNLLSLENENDFNDPHWEQKHFFLQLIRIIKNNKICLVRLMQIAYNIGQLRAEFDFYNAEIKNVFIENNLDDIESYILF